jgi:hypothetical protein
VGSLLRLDGSTTPGMAAGGLDRERAAPIPCVSPLPPLSHVTGQAQAPAPPAHERLAKHSGDGGERILCIGREGGDEALCTGLVLFVSIRDFVPMMRDAWSACVWILGSSPRMTTRGGATVPQAKQRLDIASGPILHPLSSVILGPDPRIQTQAQRMLKHLAIFQISLPNLSRFMSCSKTGNRFRSLAGGEEKSAS